MRKQASGLIGIVTIILIGCFAVGILLGQKAENTELTKIQATITAEREKTQQMQAAVALEDEKAETYQVQSQADLFSYLVHAQVEMNRDMLYSRINKRVDQMIKDDLVSEVKKLKARGYNSSINALNTVGYKEIFELLDNKTTLEAAINLIKQNTRRYRPEKADYPDKPDIADRGRCGLRVGAVHLRPSTGS